MTQVTVTNTPATTYVTATSRYASSSILLLQGQDNILTFETFKRTAIPVTSTDKYTVIPAGEEYRPDLTSYRAYGTVDFWWKIMIANSIFDVFDYVVGTTIRIPTPINLL